MVSIFQKRSLGGEYMGYMNEIYATEIFLFVFLAPCATFIDFHDELN